MKPKRLLQIERRIRLVGAVADRFRPNDMAPVLVTRDENALLGEFESPQKAWLTVGTSDGNPLAVLREVISGELDEPFVPHDGWYFVRDLKH